MSGADLEYQRMLAAAGKSSGVGLDGASLEQAADSSFNSVFNSSIVNSRRSSIIVPPDKVTITRFQNGHGFGSSGWGSVNLNDSSEQGGLDSQAVTGVTNGSGGSAFLTSGAFSGFDPTNKFFEILAKFSNPINLNAATLKLYNDTNGVNTTNLNAVTTTGPLFDGEWAKLVFSLADVLSSSGSGVGNSCVQCQLKFADKNNTPVNISVGGISYFSKPAKGTVVFCFDDGWASLWTTVKAILSKFGYRATVFTILDQLGLPGRVTLANLQSLQNIFGYEIGAHASTLSVHSKGLASLDVKSLFSEFQTQKSFLLSNGLYANTLAYPINSYNRTVIDIARQFFIGGRTTDGSQQESTPAWDPFRFRSYAVSSTDSLVSLQAKVDIAATFGTTLVLSFHDLPGTITAANLTNLVDYVATKVSAGSLQVRTLNEVLTGSLSGV